MSAIVAAATAASAEAEIASKSEHHVSSAKRFEGTYKNVAPVEWLHLLATNFGNPDWAALYPINSKGSPTGLLSPRMACKLFHDSLFILQRADENPKFLQDRLPESTHKFYKKKQWRKQLIEGARRVACRLAKGLAFSPNCTAEECFIQVVLRDTFELGWRRIATIIETLPETDKDKDFARVQRLAGNDEIGFLYKGESDQGKEKKVDFKAWFKAFHSDASHLNDHVITV